MAANCPFSIWGQLIWDTWEIICRHKHSKQYHKQRECCYQHINLYTHAGNVQMKTQLMLLNCWTYIVHACVCLAQFKNINMASNHRGVLKVDLSYGHVFYNKILVHQESSGLLPASNEVLMISPLISDTLKLFRGKKVSGPQEHLTSWGFV